MPSFTCNCGYRIALHAIPNPHEARLIWDVDAEPLYELPVEKRWDQINKVARLVVQCPECRRLYVQRQIGVNEYDAYTPE